LDFFAFELIIFREIRIITRVVIKPKKSNPDKR